MIAVLMLSDPDQLYLVEDNKENREMIEKARAEIWTDAKYPEGKNETIDDEEKRKAYNARNWPAFSALEEFLERQVKTNSNTFVKCDFVTVLNNEW